jgi:hypothetical protein
MSLERITLDPRLGELGGSGAGDGALSLTTLALGLLLVALLMMVAGLIVDGVRGKTRRVLARPGPILGRPGPEGRR